MNQKYTRLLSEILSEMGNTDHIQLSDIPDIELYMDQVTHFMDQHLSNTKRYEDDKILTKTMINNYAKNKLLPPPNKKRYTQEHMLIMIFIYYFKSFLALGDIQAILNPLTEHFFASGSDINIQDIYEEVYSMGKEQINETIHDIMDNFHTASHSFEDSSESNRDFLQMFTFICLLSFDIYMKKSVIEKMLDAFPSLPNDNKKNGNKK